ncbi:F-box domain containing protein [Tanacetum coccineum]
MKKNQKSKRTKSPKPDFISNQPDPLLQLILQGLPNTEEIVRTSILSKRWRFLWTSIPFFPSLNIDCERALKPLPKKNFKDFVTWSLANNTTVDLDSFRLRCLEYYKLSTVKKWIKAAVTRNVKSLELMFSPKNKYSAIKFPSCLITCDSLEVLRLSLYRNALRLPDGTSLKFRALRVVELNGVYLDTVEKIVGMSPLLEEFSLIDCFVHKIDPICISSSKLKTLIIRNCQNTFYSFKFHLCGFKVACPELVSFESVGPRGELVLENLVSLKKAVILPQDEMQERVLSILGDDLCEVLASISHVESLSLNLFYIQGIDAADDDEGNFPACFPNLKTLELTTTIDAFAMNVIIRILKCSPNLESLHLIIQKEYLRPKYWELDEVEPRGILIRHLKRVEFLELNGEKDKLDIARLLLKHANALEELAFSWRDKVNYNEKSMEIMSDVSKFYKASPTVKLTVLLKV